MYLGGGSEKGRAGEEVVLAVKVGSPSPPSASSLLAESGGVGGRTLLVRGTKGGRYRSWILCSRNCQRIRQPYG